MSKVTQNPFGADASLAALIHCQSCCLICFAAKCRIAERRVRDVVGIHGADSKPGSHRMHEFNQSLSYDKRMYKADIQGSRAYAAALCKAGILTAVELDEMHRGLDLVLAEWTSGKFEARPEDEDIHTANERRLSELIDSKIAGKLHTGRSRNDQVATDMRLWMLEKTAELRKALTAVIGVMTLRAETEVDHIMPGYTHLQVRLFLFGLHDCMN